MKPRRAILGGIVVAGMVVLLLGVLGVFSERPRAASASREASPGSESGEGMVMKSFSITEQDYSLHAEEARAVERGNRIEMKRPVLKATHPAGEGADSLEVSANEGTYIMDPATHKVARVVMSGDVRIVWQAAARPDDAAAPRQSTAQRLELTTDSLEIEPEAGIGRTDGHITAVVTSDSGPQKLQGEGAEFILKQRTVTIARNIRLDLTGADLLSKGAETATPQAAAPAVLTCDGPLAADGYRRTVEFSKNVRLDQGEAALAADRLEAQFRIANQGPEAQSQSTEYELERLVAEGNVRIKAEGVEGHADRLVRSAIGDQLILEGKPAAARHAAGEIIAERIELGLADKAIEVPSAGRLKFASAEGSETGPAEVSWSRMLRFIPDQHSAVIRGDVRFAGKDQVIECQTLSIMMDEQNRDIRSIQADDAVHFEAQIPRKGDSPPASVSATSDSLIFDPESDLFALSGNARVNQEGAGISGERIEYQKSDSSVRVPGGGRLEVAEDAATGRGPADIKWSGGMTLNSVDGNALFERDVSLKNGSRSLTADRLSARVGEKGEFQGLDAAGDVTFVEPSGEGRSRTVKADRIRGDLGPDGALRDVLAEGNVIIRDESGPNGTFAMRADRVSSKVGVNNELEELEATGRQVIIEEGELTAIGVRLLWNLRSNDGVLYGDPVEVREGENRLFGGQVDIDRTSGRINVSGKRRVEAIIREEKGALNLPF